MTCFYFIYIYILSIIPSHQKRNQKTIAIRNFLIASEIFWFPHWHDTPIDCKFFLLHHLHYLHPTRAWYCTQTCSPGQACFPSSTCPVTPIYAYASALAFQISLQRLLLHLQTSHCHYYDLLLLLTHCFHLIHHGQLFAVLFGCFCCNGLCTVL